MFAGQPQPVEIHHRGIWYSGELIGWRHESDGRVAARVRCRVDNLRHSAWVDLSRLRLPDPQHPPRREPYPALLPRDVAEPADDETRPHTMLAGLVTRAPKPAHATVPPARIVPSDEEPAYGPAAYETPYESATYETPEESIPAYGVAEWDEQPYEPAPYPPAYETPPVYSDRDWPVEPRRSPRLRRNEALRRHEAYLSVL
jgi:hypothetical protein